MALPTYTIEVAWTGNLTGVFRVGISQLDSTDVLGNPFNGNTFDDISSHVYAFKTTRGRSDDLGDIEQGTATINLRDYGGRFNPENASSDLYGYLVPLRPVRIRAIHNGITYGIFQGYIDRIEYDPETRESVIEAVDFFEHLNQMVGSAISFTATQSGAIVGEVLDLLEFTEPSLRSLDTGRTLTPPVSVGGPSATYLARCGDVVEADRGLFFITGGGVVRYISGASYWARTSPSVTLDGSNSSDMRVAIDKQRIVNSIVVSHILSEFSATNTASQQRYGFRLGGDIDLVLDVATEAEAQQLAYWIVATQGEPTVPTRSITVKPSSDANAVAMLGSEIGDRAAFAEPRGNTNAEGKIEGINHTVEVGTLHLTEFLVSKRSHDAFTVGFSAVDGPDFLYW